MNGRSSSHSNNKRNRLVELIRNEIDDGVYEPGRLPSINSLEIRYNTTNGTLREVIRVLEREGRLSKGKNHTFIVNEIQGGGSPER